MNNISQVSFTAPTDYSTEQESINRRRKLAEALQAQGMSPMEMPQTPQGGFTPHASWTQGAAKMAQAYVGALGQRKADERQGALAQKYQTDVGSDTQALVRAMGGRQAQTIQPDPQEASQSADYGTPEVPPVNLPAQSPTEALQQALPGMRTPMGQNLATSYLTQQIASPEKFGHTPVVMKGANGELQSVLVGDRGTVRPVQGFDVAPKVHPIAAGGQTEFRDEYGRPSGQGPIAHTQTPDSQANLAFRAMEFNSLSANQQAHLAQEAQRIGISQQALQEGRVQLVTDQNGNVHIVNKLSGVGTPATTPTGAPLNIPKPMTEAQGKANLFGSRASEAHKILMGLEDKISTTGLATKRGLENTPIVGGPMGAIANTTLSGNQQKVEQAQRDFVNAVLRVESGAAIADSEFRNAIKQYFPQPGDKPGVIAQKRQNRETAINGLGAMAGGRINTSSAITNPGASPQAVSWNDLGR